MADNDLILAPGLTEQEGRIYKNNPDTGKMEYVPPSMEQNGKTYQFSLSQGKYNPINEENNDESGKAFSTSFQNSSLLGTRPFVAGAAGALGSFVGNMQEGKGISKSLDEAGNAFNSARNETMDEQGRLRSQYPAESLAGNLVGGVMTSPLLPGVTDLNSALKVGGIMGAGRAIGEAKTPTESVQMIANDTAGGGMTYGALKGAGWVYDGATKFAKNLIPTNVLSKIASYTSGIPDSEIKNYAAKTDEINGLIKKIKGGNLPAVVDEARQKISDDIQSSKNVLAKQISGALSETYSPKVSQDDLNSLIDNTFKLAQTPGEQTFSNDLRINLKNTNTHGYFDPEIIDEIASHMPAQMKAAC